MVPLAPLMPTTILFTTCLSSNQIESGLLIWSVYVENVLLMLRRSIVRPTKTIMNRQAKGSPILVLMLSVMSRWEV